MNRELAKEALILTGMAKGYGMFNTVELLSEEVFNEVAIVMSDLNEKFNTEEQTKVLEEIILEMAEGLLKKAGRR